MLDGSVMGRGCGGASTRLQQSRACDAGFRETDEGRRSRSPPLQAQMPGRKEVCDRGIQEQPGSE